MKGKIKKLISDRGFGFIIAEDGKEVFFHRTALATGDFNALVVNTIPRQGVKTVRTEEAIYASLSVINVIS